MLDPGSSGLTTSGFIRACRGVTLGSAPRWAAPPSHRLAGLKSSTSNGLPPPVERLAARGKVLLHCADAFQEGEGALAERFAFVAEFSPRVVLLVGVTREIIELRLVVRAAQDQRPLTRGDGERHVVGDPTRLRVYGGDDLALRQIQRPGAYDERPVLVSRPRENVAERLARHGGRQASEPRELHDGWRQVRSGRHRQAAAGLQARPADHEGYVGQLPVER